MVSNKIYIKEGKKVMIDESLHDDCSLEELVAFFEGMLSQLHNDLRRYERDGAIYLAYSVGKAKAVIEFKEVENV